MTLLSIDTRDTDDPVVTLAVRAARGCEYAELFVRAGRADFGVRLREDELEELRDLAGEALAAMRGARPVAVPVAPTARILPFRPRRRP